MAAELGISQALLSHYEKGVREPGLNFVVRACDYYHVSADFMLGRSPDRDGINIGTEALYDASEERARELYEAAARQDYQHAVEALERLKSGGKPKSPPQAGGEKAAGEKGTGKGRLPQEHFGGKK